MQALLWQIPRHLLQVASNPRGRHRRGGHGLTRQANSRTTGSTLAPSTSISPRLGSGHQAAVGRGPIPSLLSTQPALVEDPGQHGRDGLDLLTREPGLVAPPVQFEHGQGPDLLQMNNDLSKPPLQHHTYLTHSPKPFFRAQHSIDHLPD